MQHVGNVKCFMEWKCQHVAWDTYDIISSVWNMNNEWQDQKSNKKTQQQQQEQCQQKKAKRNSKAAR